VLPEGSCVAANHDFEASEKFDREMKKHFLERLASISDGTDGGFVRTEVHVYRGDSDDVPPLVKMMRSRQSTVQLEFQGISGASGTYLHQYLWEEDPPRNDGSGPDLDQVDLLTAAIHALDHLQDSMCEHTRDPWPREGIAAVPAPRGRVEGAQLFLWYGDEGAPVLRLPPISLE